jgi:hypothetical protein
VGIFDAVQKPRDSPAARRATYFQRLGPGFKLASKLQLNPRRCFMSYRVLQLSPLSSTRTTRSRIAVPESWSVRSEPSLDTGFWFECDPDFDQGNAYDRTKWGALSGMALSVAVSASFWAGVVWIAARAWR